MNFERNPHHIAHLIGDVFKPRLDGFRTGDHIRRLGADDRLRAEWLPKRLALRDPLQTFLDDHALSASRGANHDPAFVVEVAQDNENSAALGAERVFDRYADVIERDVGRACGGRVGRLDGLGRDAFLTRNEDDCQAILFQRYLPELAVKRIDGTEGSPRFYTQS